MPDTRPSQEEQERLYASLANALFASVSADWREVLLRIDCDDQGSVTLTIFGPNQTRSLRIPDDSLCEPAFGLVDLFTREARPFSRCEFHLTWIENADSWEYRATYAYRNEKGG